MPIFFRVLDFELFGEYASRDVHDAFFEQEVFFLFWWTEFFLFSLPILCLFLSNHLDQLLLQQTYRKIYKYDNWIVEFTHFHKIN